MVAKAARGFTLIELIVVIAILTVVTGLILLNHNNFGGKILLENLAYDIALSVREAQVYGISVQRFGTDRFSLGYGIHFDKLSGGSAAITYVLYADAVTLNGLYDGCPNAAACELVRSTDIQRGYHIADLRVGAADSEVSANVLDILYKRPEPDACISAGGTISINPTTGFCTSSNERARIILESPRGDQKSIVVEATGQISVE